MGKKVKILSSDPILSKNFKYEKRSKTRMIEKAQSEEEKALQLKHKKEALQIEKKVDSQIEQVTAHLPSLMRSSRVAEIKQQMFDKKGSQQTQKVKIQTNVPQIVLSTSPKIENFYQYHFGLQVKESQILKEIKKTQNQKIEEETKKEIREMFNLKDEKKEDEEMEGENNEELLNLTFQCKKESQVSLDSHLFQATKNFLSHKENLSRSSQPNEDATLSLAKTFINSYFDHVFIENSQEQKIQAFRKIVVKHSLTHLSRSLEEEKGRGFTNCKILILTPFMGDARAILDLVQQQFPQYQIVNKEKADQIDDQNDFFRIGIKIAKKKKQLTYFSHFDHSEIIVASPVGLKSIIGSEGDEKRQNSFISSVQIVYIDRASALLMQNWAHLLEIFSNLNIMPKYESLKNSIDTIRDTFLQLKGRLYRQNIVFSEFNFPELNALKKMHMHNVQGGVTSKVFFKKPTDICPKYEQNFYKIELKEPRDDLSMRFQYFKRKFWDDLHNKETMSKVVLFANSYFEYVKLKSFLEKVNASAQFICEHTQKNKVQSRVAKFNEGQFRILLITERAFYFEVCQIRKFHSIYFYSLPKNSFIYENLVNSVEPNEMGVNRIVSIYTKFDLMIIERIVGTSKALEMVREYCNNVSFVI